MEVGGFYGVIAEAQEKEDSNLGKGGGNQMEIHVQVQNVFYRLNQQDIVMDWMVGMKERVASRASPRLLVLVRMAVFLMRMKKMTGAEWDVWWKR